MTDGPVVVRSTAQTLGVAIFAGVAVLGIGLALAITGAWWAWLIVIGAGLALLETLRGRVEIHPDRREVVVVHGIGTSTVPFDDVDSIASPGRTPVRLRLRVGAPGGNLIDRTTLTTAVTGEDAAREIATALDIDAEIEPDW
ncbi:MAG: hypothetical protein AAGK32_20845 [Actinomycetota bacterium]